MAQVVKSKLWKIQLIHLIILTAFSLALSQVHLIDYKSIDIANYEAKPSVHVPTSLYYNKEGLKDYDHLIFKMRYISKDSIVLLTSVNMSIDHYDILDYLQEYETQILDFQKHKYAPRLRADKNIPIRYVKEFESYLFNYAKHKIIYEVHNDEEFTSSYMNNYLKHSISVSLSEKFVDNSIPRIPSPFFLEEYKVFKDTITIQINYAVKISNIEVPLHKLSEELQNYINPSTVIVYVYNDKTTYQDYMNVLSAHKKAIWTLKINDLNTDFLPSELIHNYYHFSRNEALYEEKNRLAEKFPFNMIEEFR